MTEEKILVAIPHFDGDLAEAEALARLISDLIDVPTNQVGLLMVHRKDAKPVNPAIIAHCAQKFFFAGVWKSNRAGAGFPMGPNEMYFAILAWMANINSGLKAYGSVFILEADCVITRKNWHLELLEEWTTARKAGKLVMGAKIMTGYEGFPSHINASAVYDSNITRRIPELVGCSGNIGWDYYFGSKIVPVAYDSPNFRLDYHRKNVTEKELFSGPLVYHGVKDDSARNLVREKYKLDAPTRVSIPHFAESHQMKAHEHEDGTWTLTPYGQS